MACGLKLGVSEIIYSQLSAVPVDCVGCLIRDILCIIIFLAVSALWYLHPDRSKTPMHQQICWSFVFLVCVPFFEFVLAAILFCVLLIESIKYYFPSPNNEAARDDEGKQGIKIEPEDVRVENT